jgi:hypothetical protein
MQEPLPFHPSGLKQQIGALSNEHSRLLYQLNAKHGRFADEE